MSSIDTKLNSRCPFLVFLVVLCVLGTRIPSTESFSTIHNAASRTITTSGQRTSGISRRGDASITSLCSIPRSSCSNNNDKDNLPDRRDVLLAGAGLLTTAAWTAPNRATAAGETYEGEPMVRTESGLRYVELELGRGPPRTPQYGQLCVISYTGYLQLPKDNKRQKFASQSNFVLKHGNGKLIAGLDEGLHTMRRGGRRRLIIPPKLGFVASGLGPLPEFPWQRGALNRLLAEMVEQRGGNLIYDVTLERFFDDEADQGYYQDDEISPEEFAELNRRLNRGQNSALDSVGEAIELSDRDREKPIV